MQILENKKLGEKAYIEELDNGPKVIIVPKKNVNKKYAIIGVKFGSIDNCFINPKNNKKINIPDGVAHFLEHKMFEQENGTNSLDTLSALGVNANAYTTNDHTAYLIECTDNFDQAFEELMNYVQNPYFTKENVEKEKGIICQEITMYDDDPTSKVYLNILDCLYKNNPVKIDIAGTIESVNSINKDILYDCYNTFYNPSNLVISLCGDFDPYKMMDTIRKMIIEKDSYKKIERIYPEEPKEINKSKVVEKMDISIPIFVVGIKDTPKFNREYTRKSIALEILCNIIAGNSSKLYKKLYDNGDILSEFNFEYESSVNYAHLLIAGQSENPEKVLNEVKAEINNIKKNGISQEEFSRIKKKVYGGYITDYNDVSDIAKMFMIDCLNNVDTLESIEEFSTINLDYINQVLDEVFIEKNIAISIITPN